MSAPPYLTDDEIEHITAPLTQGAARCRFIRDQYRVTVKERPNGQPLVWRAEFEAAGGQIKRRGRDPAPGAGEVVRPNWERLRANKGNRRSVVG